VRAASVVKEEPVFVAGEGGREGGREGKVDMRKRNVINST